MAATLTEFTFNAETCLCLLTQRNLYCFSKQITYFLLYCFDLFCTYSALFPPRLYIFSEKYTLNVFVVSCCFESLIHLNKKQESSFISFQGLVICSVFPTLVLSLEPRTSQELGKRSVTAAPPAPTQVVYWTKA